MRPSFAYVPGGGRLQRASVGSAAIYLGSMAAAALLTDNPIVIVAALAAAVIAGRASGAGRALRSAFRMGLTLGLLLAALTALLAGRGETVLIRVAELAWPGRIDVTLEGLFGGGILGLRVVTVLVVFAVWSATVDPDRVMRRLRPLAKRSALTVAVAIRLVPVTAADSVRLREAATLRGPGASSVGRAAMARRLLAGALERATDVAATLELRGYGLDRRVAAAERGRSSARDGRFALAGLAVVAVSVALRAAGLSDTEPYPSIQMEMGPAVIVAALAIPALAWFPFASTAPRRRVRRIVEPARG